MSVLHKVHAITPDNSPEKLAYDKQVAHIRAAYDKIKCFPPDPAALSEYSRAMREAIEAMNAARAKRLDPYNILHTKTESRLASLRVQSDVGPHHAHHNHRAGRHHR